MGRESKKAMPDAWRTYLELAMGVTEASRKRATKAAKELMGKTGATAEQVQTFAEDLLNASSANREAMVKLVRFELDKALGRVGLATADEVTELTTRVRELEEQLREARARGQASPAADSHNGNVGAGSGAIARRLVQAGAASRTAKKTAKKAVAKKAGPAKAATKKATPATKKATPAAKKASTATDTVAPAKKATKKAVKKAGGTA